MRAVGLGLALLACPALAAAAVTTHFRSIGTAANYGTLEALPVNGNGTQAQVTLGSNVVIGTGGTTWKAVNRGRGDRITLAGVDYTILEVKSDTVATLTRPYIGGTSVVNYTLSRKFTTLEAWGACIEGWTACEGVSTSSLVADDRAEVGVAYKDSAFVPPNGVFIPNNVASITTDATHGITLTADPGNRHHGVPGAGVLIHNPGCVSQVGTMLLVEANHFTLEWMEVRDSDSDGVHVTPQSTTNHYVIRNNIIGFPNCSFAATGIGSDALDLDSNVVSVMSADVYDNVISQGRYNVIIDAFDEGTSSIDVYNNTIYNCGIAVPCGIRSLALSNNHIRFTNNIVHTGVGTQVSIPIPHPSSGRNITSDATATTSCPGASCQCPAGGCQINVALGSLSFVNAAGGDLHILSPSVARDAGTPLGTVFTTDIDGQVRSGSWDVGADEFGAVACCGLTVAETASTLTVTGADEFELRFNTATGAGIDDFRDLTEDPTIDLAGGSTSQQGLFDDELDGNFHTSFDARGRIHLLEATPARVKARQQARYSDGSTATGLEGLGDYTIYPSGRMALGWSRKRTLAVPYAKLELNWTSHYQVAPPLNGWAGFSQSGSVLPNQPGTDDFVLLRSDATQARTDFLTLLSSDWVGAHGADAVAGGWPGFGDLYETTWVRWTAGTLPVPSVGAYSLEPGENWSFLTYFKPTTLGTWAGNAWQDPAVTSRSTDYRTAAVPYSISGGGQWQDANENTGTLGDFFNESEAAYVFDMTPSPAFIFDIAGTVANPRYSPFFKIRGWRSLAQSPTVTFEGTLLRKDVDYKAAVKPISRAWKTGDLSWHCTLQDATACDSGNIDVGGGVGVVLGGSSIAPARYGNGLSVVSNDAYITAPSTDFSMGVGALDFWYQPNYDSTSGTNHMLWNSIGGVATDYDCVWLQHGGGNLVFRAYLSADNQNCNTGGSNLFTLTATAANYSWRPKDWVHIRAEWNSSSFVRLLVDGRVVASGGGFSVVGYSVGNVRMGSCQITCPGGVGSTNADGTIDEPHIYFGMGSSGNPEPMAHGGLVGDSRESLADSGLNQALLSFSVGPGRKGQYLYLGADSRFRGLNVSLATKGAGVAPGALVFQYWRDNGAGTEGWADLEGVAGFSDGTADFTRSGTVKWDADPANWQPYSVNGGPDLFYVRISLSGFPVSYSTSPVESVVTTDILLFQYCGDITDGDATFVFSVPPTTAVELLSFAAVAGDGSVAPRLADGVGAVEPGLPRLPGPVGGRARGRV